MGDIQHLPDWLDSVDLINGVNIGSGLNLVDWFDKTNWGDLSICLNGSYVNGWAGKC